MRFAYIDSQGKEVGIPSVEALQLRIELGAITEETIFYDASKDRWDPAGDHEIFRTLSREIRERGSGGGPRPPTPKVEPRATGEDETDRNKARAADPFEGEQDPLADTAEPGEVGWVEVELEDLAQPESDVPVAGKGGGDEWDVDLGEFGELDLAPGLEESDQHEGAPPPSEPIGVDAPSTSELPDGEASADALDDSSDVGAGLKLEEAWADTPMEGATVVDDSDLELEQPLSEQESMSAEGEPEPVEATDDLDFSGPLEIDDPETEGLVAGSGASAGDDGVASDEADTAEERPDGVPSPRMPGGTLGRRDPYQRRVQPPRAQERPRRARSLPRRRGRGPGALVMGLVGAVVVAGGWYGWSALRGDDTGGVELEESVVAIPELPAELEPVMRPVADSAHADMLASLRAMAAEFELTSEPNPDWLAGVYLANAGSYRDVVLYWGALRGYIGRVRGADEDVFLEAVRGRMSASDVPPEAEDTLFARIRAGFRATAADRRDVYDDVDDLIDSATGLHEFLVANQANIAYEPAVGLSRDPVTEAIPSSPALGEEMWERVGRIPNALDALGTLDRVTTERILDVVLRRIEAVGVR